MLERQIVVPAPWGVVQRRVRGLVPAPIRRLDRLVFRAVARQHIPVVGPLLPLLSRAANHSRLWIALAALLAGGGGRFGRRASLRGMLALGLTSAVTNLPGKLLTGRVRPDLAVVPEIRRLARVPASTSFPSGHAASAFAFATAASVERPALRLPLFTLAGAVAISRVYTGVHYPGDVLAGATIGAAIARATTAPWPLADDTPASGHLEDQAARYVDADGTGLVIVANAGAGNALAPAPARKLRDALPGAHILEVEPGEDLQRTLRRAAEGARVLGVAGGDGSASAGAEVAAEAGIPLLVIPAGTLNHLARDLGLEQLVDTIRAVRSGRVSRMDLGDIDGNGFVNAASLGAYPHLVRTRESLEDRLGKWPATVWSAIRILATQGPADLDIDGHRRRVWLLFVGNGCFTATGLAPSRRRRLDDGLLDVRLADAERPWARTRILGSMLTGRLGRCASYHRWTAAEVRLRSDAGSLRLAADGEVWTGPDMVTIRKRPGALLVLQPGPASRMP